MRGTSCSSCWESHLAPEQQPPCAAAELPSAHLLLALLQLIPCGAVKWGRAHLGTRLSQQAGTGQPRAPGCVFSVTWWFGLFFFLCGFGLFFFCNKPCALQRLVSRTETLQLSMGGAACLRLQAAALVTAQLKEGAEDNLSVGWRQESSSARPVPCCSTPGTGGWILIVSAGKGPCGSTGMLTCIAS